MCIRDSPNGSMYAIEGIVSRDGRVLGKMGHSERQGENRFKNVYGLSLIHIFKEKYLLNMHL